MNCPSCGGETPNGRFCMHCGAALTGTCRVCGEGLPPEALFCPSCGASQERDEHAGQMLKLVTVLFSDVVGFTSKAEISDPDVMHERMSSYFSAMAAEVRAEGGTVERLLGDAVMAVFGIPTAHEDDPVRAVRAGLRMLARLEQWNASAAAESRMVIRIGVNTGEVMTMGTPGRELLVSDAVNIAARLQSEANPGHIVVGERTARAIQNRFDLEPLGLLTVKGKSQPVRAFVVGDERRESTDERGIPGVSARLVGRAGQLGLLNSLMTRVRKHKQPSLVTVHGDAGIGKTRLLREFLEGLGHDVKVLVGRCLPYGEAVSFWPLAEILKTEAGILDNDGPELVRAKISRFVANTVPLEVTADDPGIVEALGLTLGTHIGEQARPDPRQSLRELVLGWRAAVAGMAREAPVALVIDDLHWADPTMLEVLEELATHIEGPVLVVCLTRPDLFKARSDWGAGVGSHTTMSLDPLTESESSALFDSLLESADLPAEMRHRILRRSEGNPFYLEEMVRRLIDEGHLTRSDDRWHFSGDVEEVEIPDSVQAVILARLDLLAPEEKTLLQKAAVIGRTFWRGALGDVAPHEDIDMLLRALERREFIRTQLVSSMSGELEYQFKHVLIRDVAYESLPRRVRGQTHASVARWVESQSGPRLAEFSEQLAHHYDRAWEFTEEEDFREPARSFALTAAKVAAESFALQRAELFAQRALALSTGTQERIEALESLGDLYYRVYRGDGAWDAYRRALEEADSAEMDATALARLAAKAVVIPTRYAASMHQFVPQSEIDPLIDLGLAAARPEDRRERALLLSSKAFSQAMGYSERDERGAEAARTALAIAEEVGEPDLISAALDAIGAWLLPDGRYGEIARIEQRRLDIADQLTDPKEVGDAFAMASLVSTFVGHYGRAVDQATECIDRSRAVDAGSYRIGLMCRVTARFIAGDWNGSLLDQAEIEDFDAEEGQEFPAPFAMRAYCTAMFCHQLRGELDESDRYLELIRRFRKQQDLPPNLEAVVAGRLAFATRALAHRGEVFEAADWLILEPSAYLAATLEAACEVFAEQGDWDAAARLIPMARQEAETKELLALAFFADRLEGRMAIAGGERDRGYALLARSGDGFAELGAPWESAWSNLLVGELLPPASGRVQGAATVFENLSSVRELERARALI